MTRTVLLSLILCAVTAPLHSVSGQESSVHIDSMKKKVALYAPRPQYERSWPEGTGVFVLDVEKTGVVANANVFNSTGHKILDASALETLRRWRFQPGTARQIKVPMTFAHWRPQNYRSSVISGY